MMRALFSAVDFNTGGCFVVVEWVEEISDEFPEVESVVVIYRSVRIS